MVKKNKDYSVLMSVYKNEKPAVDVPIQAGGVFHDGIPVGCGLDDKKRLDLLIGYLVRYHIIERVGGEIDEIGVCRQVSFKLIGRLPRSDLAVLDDDRAVCVIDKLIVHRKDPDEKNRYQNPDDHCPDSGSFQIFGG